jgi:hypothetical protein
MLSGQSGHTRKSKRPGWPLLSLVVLFVVLIPLARPGVTLKMSVSPSPSSLPGLSVSLTLLRGHTPCSRFQLVDYWMGYRNVRPAC